MALAISARGVSKRYLISHVRTLGYATMSDTISRFLKFRRREAGPAETTEEFWALRDVGFEVEAGARVGLIGRENVFLNGVILGMTRAEVRRKFDGNTSPAAGSPLGPCDALLCRPRHRGVSSAAQALLGVEPARDPYAGPTASIELAVARALKSSGLPFRVLDSLIGLEGEVAGAVTRDPISE